jgi:hypothetical protein
MLTVAAVARRLGLSRGRVRQLDGELGAVRCQCGARSYAAAAVEAYASRRADAAAARAARRAARLDEIRARRRATSAAWRARKRQERGLP